MLRSLVHALVALGVLLGAITLAVARGETPVRRVEPPARVEPAPERALPGSTEAPADTWIGVVVPLEEVEVAAPVHARIEAVHVRLGDAVERDQVLVSIDRRQVEKELAAARASLQALRAALAEAELELERADDQRRRTRSLGDVVAEQERTEAELARKVAAARLERATAEVAEQRALVAQLETLRLDADVRAPFAGTVSLRHVDSGAFTPEGAPLIELVSDERILRMAAPGDARVGARLRVTCGEARLHAVVERVAPQREVASGMTLVEARIELDAGASRPAIGERCEAAVVHRP